MLYNSNSYDDAWHNCLVMIQKQTSPEEFVKWFKPIVPVGFDGTTLRLRVPSESYVYHIEKNYIPFLKPIIRELFGHNTRLRYSIPQTAPVPSSGGGAVVHGDGSVSAGASGTAEGDTSAISAYLNRTDTRNIKNPFVIPGIRKIVVDPQLNFEYNFDNFVEGECNRLARSAGMAVSVDPGRTPFNPLFIYGDSGLGKTHVAQAVGIEVKKRFPDRNVLYVSTHKFQAQFQNAAMKGELNDFIHFYQMIDVLILDDIQELAGKDKTQNTFFNIFNHLHLSRKQLILTSDKPPVELKDIEQRLLTRFKWGLSVQLTAPDYGTKVKIIGNKCRKLGVHIPEEVVDFLANHINANIREIEGAISSLTANATLLGKEVTIDLARDILKAYVRCSQKDINIELIQETVCGYFNMSREDLHSRKRTRDIAQARQVAMYLAKKMTKLPLKCIGQNIGGKDHATVVHACKTISNLMETDRAFRQQVEDIIRKIKA